MRRYAGTGCLLSAVVLAGQWLSLDSAHHHACAALAASACPPGPSPVWLVAAGFAALSAVLIFAWPRTAVRRSSS